MEYPMSKIEGKVNPMVISATALRKKGEDQPADVITGLIKEGEQILIYSATGSYKSWLATCIWMAVANGVSVARLNNGLDKWKAPKKRKVFVLDGELGSYDLGQRINQLAPNYGEAEAWVMMRQLQGLNSSFPDIGKPDNQDELVRNCLREGVELLVLDNLTTLAEVIDENSASAMKPVVSLLQKLKAAGIATILIHHSNKSDSSYRGSTAIGTTFNAIIKLKRESLVTGGFSLTFDKARNSHIEHQALNLRLVTKDDDSLFLEADAELNKLEVMVNLVRSLDYWEDKQVGQALEDRLGEAHSQGAFSKWKRKAIAEKLIKAEEWESCLVTAFKLANADDRRL